MPDRDFIVTPPPSPITVALEPAHNALNSLLLLKSEEPPSGVGEWVMRTVEALTPEERDRNRLVMLGLHFATMTEQSWASLPAYTDHLAAMDPAALRDKLMHTYARIPLLKDGEDRWWMEDPVPLDLGTVLESVDSYLAFLHARFACEGLDEELEAQAYALVIDPRRMQETIVSHLRHMWTEHLANEWQRVRPMLEDSVRAFQELDLASMDKTKAVRVVTGQDLDEHWQHKVGKLDRLIFVPSAHVGPYLGKYTEGTGTMRVFFGARLPEGTTVRAPDLSRNEILVRLSALADNNRLRILELIAERGEQCSQEVIDALELSQSAASRHLKQLTATGYLVERRRDGAKCFRLNPERIQGTLQAISNHLGSGAMDD